MSEDGEEEFTTDGERVLPGELKQIKGNVYNSITMFDLIFEVYVHLLED